jgi:hypothetical protein
MSDHTDEPTDDEDDVEGHLRMTNDQLDVGTTPKQALADAANQGPHDTGPLPPTGDT